MWARVGKECFMEVMRFELSLEEFESKEIGLVQSRQWVTKVTHCKETIVTEKRETTKRLD